MQIDKTMERLLVSESDLRNGILLVIRLLLAPHFIGLFLNLILEEIERRRANQRLYEKAEPTIDDRMANGFPT